MQEIGAYSLVGVKTGAANREMSVKIPKKLETDLPHNLARPFLGKYPKDSMSWYRDT